MLNNFIVKGYHIKINENFNDLGHEIRDEIDSNLNKSSSIDYINTLSNNNSIQIPMGTINQYNFFMEYKNTKQFSNRKPQYIVECNGIKNNLPENHIVFMGYYKNNLLSPKFIGIEENKNYIYLEDKYLDNYMIENNIKCK